MHSRLQTLQAALASYREQFRNATPLERSALLAEMRVLMDEVDHLNSLKPHRVEEACVQDPAA